MPCPLKAALTWSHELTLATCTAGLLDGVDAWCGAARRCRSAVNTTCPPTRRGLGAPVTLASRAVAVPTASGALPVDVAALAEPTPSSARLVPASSRVFWRRATGPTIQARATAARAVPVGRTRSARRARRSIGVPFRLVRATRPGTGQVQARARGQVPAGSRTREPRAPRGQGGPCPAQSYSPARGQGAGAGPA